jgi:hypothetical protein
LPIFLHLVHGRSPIYPRPLGLMPSRSTVSCARLPAEGCFEDGDKRFSLTPLADPLRQDAAHSIRPQALWSGSEAYRRTWGDLSYSVRTGEPAFDHVYGKPFFEYLAEDRAFAKIFNDVMTSASSDEGAAIAAGSRLLRLPEDR